MSKKFKLILLLFFVSLILVVPKIIYSITQPNNLKIILPPKEFVNIGSTTINKNGDSQNQTQSCDLDDDQDKIQNCQDKCPKEAETHNNYQDEDGCPDQLPESQTNNKDKDDIPDEQDNCSDVYNPKQEDADQDKIGDACDPCDDNDDDLDRVKNCLDECPKEQEIYNNYQDDDGCPDKNEQTENQNRQSQEQPKKDTQPNEEIIIINEISNIKIKVEELKGDDFQVPSASDSSSRKDAPKETNEAQRIGSSTPVDMGAADNLIQATTPTAEVRVPCFVSGTLYNFKYLSNTVKVKTCEAERIGGGCLSTSPFTCSRAGYSCKSGGSSGEVEVERVWTGAETYRNPGPLSYRAPVSCNGLYLIQPINSPFEDECPWQGTWTPAIANHVQMEGASKNGYDFSFNTSDLNPPSLNVGIISGASRTAHLGEGSFSLSVSSTDRGGIRKIKIKGNYTVSYFQSNEKGPLEIARTPLSVAVDEVCDSSPCNLRVPYYAGGKQISFDLQLYACDNAGNKISSTYQHTFPDTPGDLAFVQIDPVQVVYDAPLVKNKNTAFRAKINSTFNYPVEVDFNLNLPRDKWGLTSKTGSRLIGFAPDWHFPQNWGPVKIPANARDFEIMLPVIADWQKNETGTGSNDAGKMLLGEDVGGVWGLDVRLMPVPIADRVNFSAQIDLDREIAETNERNNQYNSGNYDIAKTKAWNFLFASFRDDSFGTTCAPTTTVMQDAAEKQLAYLLGTYPIADSKIEYGFAYGSYSTPCAGEPDGTCNFTRAFNVGRGEFLNWIGRLAADSGYDFGVATGCYGGGGAILGYDKAVFIGGTDGREEVLAHEFNHAQAPVDDIYALDCYSSWAESYCQLPDGDRFYCCWEQYADEKARREGNGVDPHQGCIINCGASESACDSGCCHDLCRPQCDAQGGTLYYAPDLRPSSERIMPAANGWWVNKWTDKTGKQYFMDGPTGDNWMTKRSVREEGFHFCPGASEVDHDGYLNLLNNAHFKSATDPQGLLVSGILNKNGEVKLDPFIYLPETFLDIEPGAKGEYNFILYDENDSILSKSGFDAYFYQPDPNGGPINEVPFVYRIEWKDGTKKIELQNKDGKILAARDVSPNKPEVKIISPDSAGKYYINEPLKIEWSGSDKDGDKLTYNISISDDNGENWLPITIDVVESYLKLPSNQLSEGKNYLIKVKATDGVNTSEAISDNFKVLIKPEVKKGFWNNKYFIALEIIALIFIALTIGYTYLKKKKKA